MTARPSSSSGHDVNDPFAMFDDDIDDFINAGIRRRKQFDDGGLSDG